MDPRFRGDDVAGVFRAIAKLRSVTSMLQIDDGASRAAVLVAKLQFDPQLLHGPSDPFQRDVLAVIRRDRGQPALILQEIGLLSQCLRRGTVGASAEPFR